MESNLNQGNEKSELQSLHITTEEAELQAVTNDSNSLADSSVNASAQEQLQMDTPAEGDCLFWAVMLGMLVRFKDSDNFQTVVSRLFGKEDAKANADDLRDRLLPMYQGRVSDIQSFDTSHAFYRLMMLFRARVANHIAEAKELHDSIEGNFKAYCERMSRQGEWGGEIEIKAMASLLETDIVVRRQGELERRVPANAERVTMDALHIAHVSASAESSVNNHYHFLVPKSHAYWPRTNDNHEEKKTSDEGLSSRNQTVQSNNNAAPSPIEQAARACVTEYNKSWVYNYLEMDLLVKLLQSRRVGMARDISFENKILWTLVYSNESYREVKADPSQYNEFIRSFLLKYNRGDQDLLDSKKGESAKFPGALRGLLMSLAGHLEAHTNFPCLRQMDSDSMSHMLPFLTTQEQVSLFSTCKALNERSSVFIKPINKLLYLVSRGRQAEAEEMIRANPELLQQKGDITDGAGRYFKQITALQYAVWALDAHMWTMMLPYFDQINARSSAGDQLRTLEEKGLEEHGSHFDFKPLLDAYAAFNRRPSEAMWCRGVGDQQLRLPDNMAQEFLTPDQSFLSDNRTFTVQGGRPSVHQDYGVKWWRMCTRTRRPGALTGTRVHYTVDHNTGYEFRYYADYREMGEFALSYHLKDQCAVVQALCSQRAQDLSDLLAAFSMMPSQAPESNSPGRKRQRLM